VKLSREDLRELWRYCEYLLENGWVREVCVSESPLAVEARKRGWYWWRLYELPLARLAVSIATSLGMEQAVWTGSGAEDPFRAQLEYLQEAARAEVDGGLASAEILNVVVNGVIAARYSIAAVAYFNVSMDRLLARASEGDLDALRKAVSVDRMALATAAGSAIVADAQLRGDRAVLLKVLSGREPHEKRKIYRALRFMTRVLGDVGDLDKGIYADVVDLLASMGLDPKRGEDSGRLLRELVRGFLREAAK